MEMASHPCDRTLATPRNSPQLDPFQTALSEGPFAHCYEREDLKIFVALFKSKVVRTA